MVYIREAHPTDGWFGKGVVEIRDPATHEERRRVAGACMKALGLTVPPLVDDMEDTANLAYAAWPERLYVIGKDGRIAYAGGMGPFHFDPLELLKFLRGYPGQR